MDDVVAAGGRFLTALEPYTLEQAAGSLDQLALLHSEHWQGASLDRFSWLRRPLHEMAKTPWLSAAALQELMDGERGIPLQPATKNAERIQNGITALAKLSTGRSECLVHGDAHAGNIFEMSGAPSLIDWQLLQRGPWALDVPYHLAATLRPEDRRAAEQDLLRHYLDRLRAYGVEPPAWEEAWSDYRAYMTYGFFLWAMTRRVAPAITHEFVKRLGLAVTDLGSFELLGV
jgi:Ser/Thr protein kinase RdoA (MazF antagonist)